MKLVATRRTEQNRAPIAPWTAVHFSAGLALGLLDASRAWSVGGALGYEVAEQLVERSDWGTDLFETRGPESASNVLVDMVVFIAGHWLGTRWLRT